MTSREVVDVVVVGGGLAGLSAALAAQERQPACSVLILDKEANLGGNSAKASSGINGSEDFSKYIQDTLLSGKGRCNSTLVETLVHNSANSIHWLEENFHLDLSYTTQLGGHSIPRTHRNCQGPNVGFYLISALRKAITSNPHIQIRTEARVTRLLQSPTNHAVTGVAYQNKDGEEMEVSSSAVVLATGGYAASPEKLQELTHWTTMFPTTNGPWATGDALDLARSIEASFVDLDQVQIHPTGFLDRSDPKAKTKFLAPEGLRGAGGILINDLGERFVNELTTRDKVVDAILNQRSQRAFLLLSKAAGENYGAALEFYCAKKLAFKVGTFREIAEFSGSPESTLRDTINEYNQAANGKRQDSHGRIFLLHHSGPSRKCFLHM